jgi:hypothetical protein
LLGVAGVGTLGVFGKLPPSLQATFNGIIGPGIAQGAPPTVGPLPPVITPGTCDKTFIPATQYVAAYGSSFVTVLKGQVVFTGSQSDAENYYNAHVCGG